MRTREPADVRADREMSHPCGSGTVASLLRRNISAITGVAGLALAAACAVSLATWAVDDPSLSHATDHAARNILGFPGAVIADLLTQLFGLAASVVLLPPVVWAWRAVFARPSRLSWLTAVAWVIAVLTTSLALSTLPVPATWPLTTGLGGGAGEVLAKIPAAVMRHRLHGVRATAFAGLEILVALVAILTACGVI